MLKTTIASVPTYETVISMNESSVTSIRRSPVTLSSLSLLKVVTIVGKIGPPGPTGATGPTGGESFFDDLSPLDGDIIRYNQTTGAWEAKTEPFNFKQINLLPQTEAVEDTAGGVIFKSNAVYVCRET